MNPVNQNKNLRLTTVSGVNAIPYCIFGHDGEIINDM